MVSEILAESAPNSPDAVFHMHSVSKTYKMEEVEVHALRSVDLDLLFGEFVVVSAVEDNLLIAEIERTAYVTPGTVLQVRSAPKASKLRVGSLQPKEQPIVLRPGDPLVLTDASIPGKPFVNDTRGRLMMPASIAVALPEVFRDVRSGDKIWLDGGAIGGIVRSVTRTDQG
jgi:hypothetical protein